MTEVRTHPSFEKQKEQTRVANIKSQEKRIRTNERARLRNQSVKSALRTAVRGFREAVEAGEKDKAAELLVSTSRKLDRPLAIVVQSSSAAGKSSLMDAVLAFMPFLPLFQPAGHTSPFSSVNCSASTIRIISSTLRPSGRLLTTWC